jgi:hypothetical protein
MSAHRDCKPSRSPRLASALVLAFPLLLAALSASGQGVPKKEFPRLGGYQIGSTPFDGYADPAYHREIAKLDYAILGRDHKDINEYAAEIRRLNPTMVLVKYTKLQSISVRYKGYSEIKRNKVSREKGPNTTNAFDWWARDAEGEPVSNWGDNWTVNITDYVKPDASGDRFPEWAAKLDYEWWLKEDVWDGAFEDSVYWRPRRPSGGKYPDWSGGKERDGNKIGAAFRLGHQAYWNKLKELSPDHFMFVNHDWYLSEDPRANGRWDLPEYDKQVHGGLLERIMVAEDLENTRRMPWNKALTYYRRSMSYFLEPNITLFVVQGDPSNYRFFRYTFATCLLDDGYYDFAPERQHYGTVEWFDEFDLAGTASTSWLGLALDRPPTSAWRAGVWRRDFEGGVALVNPKGNGVVTVELEDGFRRIAGRQAPAVNNGQPASRITLQDGDGIILVRESVATAPPPPKPPVLWAE